MTKAEQLSEQLGSELMQADGFDEAIIGYAENIKEPYRIVYSVKKIIAILVSEGMSEEDAMEHFYYNIAGSYMGEKTPLFCNDEF